MAYATNSIANRIEWCRRQRSLARTHSELQEWRAEEEGLRDALLNRDHTTQYQYSPPDVFERYSLGLHDGQALMRAELVDQLVRIHL